MTSHKLLTTFAALSLLGAGAFHANAQSGSGGSSSGGPNGAGPMTCMDGTAMSGASDTCLNHGGLRDPKSGGGSDITGSTGNNNAVDPDAGPGGGSPGGASQ